MKTQIIDTREILGHEMNIYGDFENPLFLAKDVAKWIGVDQVAQMLKPIDEDEKLMLVLQASGQNREAWFLTEDGLYEVLMLSRKPIAKQFKKQVKKILKEIRKTGSYNTNQAPGTLLEALKLAVALEEQKEALKFELEETQNKLDQAEICLDTGMYYYSLKRRRELTGKQYRQHALKRGSEELGFERHKTANPHFSSKYTYAEAVYEWVDTFMPDSVSFVAIE